MEATYRITLEHKRIHEGDTQETLAAGKLQDFRLQAGGPRRLFYPAQLEKQQPCCQGQVKVLVRLSTGLLWPGPGLNHYITKGKSRL